MLAQSKTYGSEKTKNKKGQEDKEKERRKLFQTGA
jgi:hypothetical protein